MRNIEQALLILVRERDRAKEDAAGVIRPLAEKAKLLERVRHLEVAIGALMTILSA